MPSTPARSLSAEAKQQMLNHVVTVASAALEQALSSPGMSLGLSREQHKGIIRQVSTVAELLIDLGGTGLTGKQVAAVLAAKLLGVAQIADLGDREACGAAVGLWALSVSAAAPRIGAAVALGPPGWSLIAVQVVFLLYEAYQAGEVCSGKVAGQVAPFSPSLQRGANSMARLQTA